VSARACDHRFALGFAIAIGCSRGDVTAPPVAAADPGASPSTAPAPVAEESAPAAEPEPPSAAPVAPPTAPPEPEPEPEPAPAEPTTPARPIDDAKGMRDVDLVDQHGPPDEKNGERWTYRYPRDGGCVDREIVYTLRLKNRVVVEVKRSTRQTGKHCAPVDMP
jgi:hypothetical protein